MILPRDGEFHILELCCGEGLLAGALLEGFPHCIAHGYDGSEAMLQKAKARLANFGERFQTRHFDLADSDWRSSVFPFQAIVSSLAIHHLDGPQKQQLFRDIYRMLNPGGMLIIADVIQPAAKTGKDIAANTWDNAVRQRALEIDGDTSAFDYFQEEKWNLYRYPDPVDKPSSLFDQLKWLEQAGFSEIDVFWMKAGHVVWGGISAP